MLTPEQFKLLEFIDRHIKSTGVAPSYREMATGLGKASHGMLYSMVGEIVEKGYLRRLPGKRRAIEVVRMSAAPLAAELPRPNGYSCSDRGNGAYEVRMTFAARADGIAWLNWLTGAEKKDCAA